MEVWASDKIVFESMVKPPEPIKLCLSHTIDPILYFHIILVDFLYSPLQVLKYKWKHLNNMHSLIFLRNICLI